MLPSDSSIVDHWKPVLSKKRYKEKGVGQARAPKGHKKEQYLPPIGSKVLRTALSKKAVLNPIS
jgi:hypothetical protein